MISSSSHRRSFTLLELIVATAIVVTGLLYLQSAMTNSLDNLSNALKQRTARTLARQTLERVLASGGQAGGSGGFEEPEYADFQYNVEQQELTVAQNQKLIRISVTVQYLLDQDDRANSGNDFDGPAGSFSLTTYMPAPKTQ